MEPETAVQAITLDAAGTLIRVARPVAESYAQFARECAIPATAEQIGRQFRILFPRMTPLAFGHCDERELQRQERNWWQTLVRNCLGPHARHSNFPAFFDQLYSYYASAEAWRLYPEVPTELERLMALNLPLSVVSNFDSRLSKILDALGIHGYFRHVHYSSRSGCAKPQAGIFKLACEGLDTVPAATLHVGDNHKLDYIGATQAGLKALLLDRSAQAGDGQMINSLDGLADRLASRD